MLAKTRAIDYARLSRMRVSLIFIFACLVLACVLASQIAHGADAAKTQLTGDYFTMPLGPYENAAKVRELETSARMSWVDGGITESSDQFKNFTEYYKSYVPRKFAQPDSGPEINDIVYSTIRGLESTSRSGSALMKQRAQPMIRDVMVTIATKPVQGKYFNPTARINATLVLANLNAAAAEGGAPPKPDTSKEVAGTLYNMYLSAEMPTGVRLVALGGLRRHAVLLGANAPASYKTVLLTQGKALLEGTGPDGLKPTDLPADAYAFVQNYAVDIVAAAGSPEDKKWLVERLQEILTNEESSPIIANAAARRLGALTAQLKETSLDKQRLVAWAERTHRALTGELDRLKGLTPPAISIPQQVFIRNQGTTGGFPGGGMGGSGGYEDPYGGEDDDGGAGLMGGSGGMMPGGPMGGDGYDGYGGMGGMGGMSGVKQEPDLIASRRIVNAHLESQLVGMAGGIDTLKPEGGILMAIGPDDKELAEELAASLTAVVDEVNKKTNSSKQRYMFVLEDQAKSLKKWIDRHKVVTKEDPAEDKEDDKPAGGDVAGAGTGDGGQTGG